MWTISELKQRGWVSMKRNYWLVVLVALIGAVFCSGSDAGMGFGAGFNWSLNLNLNENPSTNESTTQATETEPVVITRRKCRITGTKCVRLPLLVQFFQLWRQLWALWGCCSTFFWQIRCKLA